MFLRIARDKKISRIAINSVMVTLGMNIFIIDDTGNFVDNMRDNFVDIPIPKDGEEIILDDGFMLYDRNGLISELTSVTRKGNEITIYTNTEYKYTGNSIDNIEDIHMWFDGELGGKMFGPGFQSLYINGDEDFIKIKPSSIRFIINGNWEIKFAE